MLDSDIELIKFYLGLFDIELLPNIIKTGDYNYILGQEEIINSDRYQILKKSFQDRKPSEELCKSCVFKERF